MDIDILTTYRKKVIGVLIALLVVCGANVKPVDAKSSAKPAPTPPNWILREVEKGNRCKKFERKMSDYGLPVKWFTYIAYRESRCRVGAVNAKWRNGKIVWTLNSNGTFDSGLFQINSGWRTLTKNTCGGGLDRLLSVDCNFKMAKVLYEDGGLHHWGFKTTKG